MFYIESGGWCTLHSGGGEGGGVMVLADMNMAFKWVLDKTWICREWWDTDNKKADRIILT